MTAALENRPTTPIPSSPLPHNGFARQQFFHILARLGCAETFRIGVERQYRILRHRSSMPQADGEPVMNESASAVNP
jgi:hypothetical protein